MAAIHHFFSLSTKNTTVNLMVAAAAAWNPRASNAPGVRMWQASRGGKGDIRYCWS